MEPNFETLGGLFHFSAQLLAKQTSPTLAQTPQYKANANVINENDYMFIFFQANILIQMLKRSKALSAGTRIFYDKIKKNI